MQLSATAALCYTLGQKIKKIYIENLYYIRMMFDDSSSIYFFSVHQLVSLEIYWKQNSNKNQTNILIQSQSVFLCNVCGSLVQKPGIMKREKERRQGFPLLVLNVSSQLETCTLPKITSSPPPPHFTSSQFGVTNMYILMYGMVCVCVWNKQIFFSFFNRNKKKVCIKKNNLYCLILSLWRSGGGAMSPKWWF